MSDVCIGISGWRYPGWRGTFYPTELPQRRELEYAAGKFNSIEINGSFYSLQRPQFYAMRLKAMLYQNSSMTPSRADPRRRT